MGGTYLCHCLGRCEGPWGQDPDILPRLQQSSSQLTLVLPNAGDQALVHKCVTQWAGRSAAALSP